MYHHLPVGHCCLLAKTSCLAFVPAGRRTLTSVRLLTGRSTSGRHEPETSSVTTWPLVSTTGSFRADRIMRYLTIPHWLQMEDWSAKGLPLSTSNQQFYAVRGRVNSPSDVRHTRRKYCCCRLTSLCAPRLPPSLTKFMIKASISRLCMTFKQHERVCKQENERP